jgi:hypothetical protein
MGILYLAQCNRFIVTMHHRRTILEFSKRHNSSTNFTWRQHARCIGTNASLAPVPRGFWDDSENQLEFMKKLAGHLGITSPDKWYNVTAVDVKRNGGASLLAKYNNSILNLLASLYPKRKWLPWKFTKAPNGFWDNLENQREFMDWFGTLFESKIPDETLRMQDWNQTAERLVFPDCS